MSLECVRMKNQPCVVLNISFTNAKFLMSTALNVKQINQKPLTFAYGLHSVKTLANVALLSHH